MVGAYYYLTIVKIMYFDEPAKPFEFSDVLWHLVLPAAVLAISQMATYVRYARTAMLEVMSQDLDANAAGFIRNFVYGTLALGNNTYVRLVDLADNAPGTGPEALYVNSIIVPSGTTLDLNGLHVYARASQISGTVVGNSISQIPDSGPIALATPTSGAIAVPGELDEWTFFGRAGPCPRRPSLPDLSSRARLVLVPDRAEPAQQPIAVAPAFFRRIFRSRVSG